MKFSLFAHMERISPNLSAGVSTSDNASDERSSTDEYRKMYRELLELCVIADKAGMCTIWTGEHHGMDFTITPNPFITLTDIANHTQNVRVGTGTIVAPFWHPLKLAGEAALTDLVTGGRLDLGIARGAYQFEYDRLVPGMDAWEAGERMRELVPLLRQLWNGNCEHDGKYYSFPSTSSSPRPLQEGGPPIWIAARDPNSHQFAVDNHCNVQVTPLWLGFDEISSLMQRFNDACGQSDAPRPKIMLLHHTYVGSSSEDVAQAAQDFSVFYAYFSAWFQNKREIAYGRIAPLSEAEVAANPICSPTAMRDNLTIGTVSEVTDQIRRYQDLGYDEYAFWIDSGMDFNRKRDSLLRFVNEVMPRIS